VTSEPDVTAIPLNGTEDFLILACDGLWDFVMEEEAIKAVYQIIAETPGKDMSNATVILRTKLFVNLLSTKTLRIGAPNKFAQAVVPLACIQKVLDLNLSYQY
jgi:serine/threonine protein phosphatase PrpC